MGGGPRLNQSSPLNRHSFFYPCIVNNRNLFSFDKVNENLSNVMVTCPEINASNIYLSSSTYFFLGGGVKRERAKERIQNSASVITKESLFGTLPPQMARRLMFLSRCVAFSLPWMGCVHSHCLRSKIEGESCKLWMPPRQRHNTAKTICVDISVAPVRLCVLLLEASEGQHVKQTNNAGELV